MQFNFKRNTKLYIVYKNTRYRIDIMPDISFSQTFVESGYSNKTLHDQYNVFESAKIHRANPANFNFTIPLTQDNDFGIVLDLLLKYKSGEACVDSFDLYIDTDTQLFKIEKAIIDSGIFRITMGDILSLAVSGTASRLRTVSDFPFGTIASYNSGIYIIPLRILAELGGVEQKHITNVSLEVSNSLSWLTNDDIHNSLEVDSATNSIYPKDYYLSSRTVSGMIQKYVTNENITEVNKWSINTPLRIRVGNMTEYYLDANFPTVVYTNRLDPQEIYTQSYDFRLNQSPSDLSDLITFKE